MASEPTIKIHESWCKGCEFCVSTCTREVLCMDGGKAVVAHSENCTGCEQCVWICPDFAIKITSDTDVSSSVGEN
jgi:NAD-dependent dihydropyrimidine dehydrogenase PreA subunit